MIRLSGDDEEVCEQASFAAWRAITGGQLANTCQPFRLYRKTLVVTVVDETWKRQMESICGELIFKINGLLGKSLVTFIEFRIDPVHVNQGRKPQPGRSAAVRRSPREDLLAATSGIRDEELRRVFLRAATAALESSGE